MKSNLTLAYLLLLSSFASAEMITIAISGTVTSVDDSANLLNGEIAVGSTMTGSYTYDSETEPYSAGTYTTTYVCTNSLCKMMLNINGIVFQTDPWLSFSITNDYLGNGRDSYSLSALNVLPLDNEMGIESITWQLGNNSGSAISNMELPTDAPNLLSWPDRNQFQITSEKIGDYDNSFYIDIEVTSATLVPEPMSMSLLILGGILTLSRRHFS